MKYVLTQLQSELLLEIVRNRCPEMTARLESALATKPGSTLLHANNYRRIDLSELTPQERERLVDAVGEEFVATGLGRDWEPTPRGLSLEELLDSVNRPNLER